MTDAVHNFGGPGDAEGAPQGAELRKSERFSVLIRPAKIVSGLRELPCVMRDVSDSGIGLKVFTALPQGDDLYIEMLNGDRYPVAVARDQVASVGLAFREPVDVRKILANEGQFGKRPLRLNVPVPAYIKSGLGEHRVDLANLSQQGAGLFCDAYLAINQLVSIRGDRIPQIHAKVRWRRGNEYGLVFEQTFRLDELARLMVEIHDTEAFRKIEAEALANAAPAPAPVQTTTPAPASTEAKQPEAAPARPRTPPMQTRSAGTEQPAPRAAARDMQVEASPSSTDAGAPPPEQMSVGSAIRRKLRTL